MSKLDMLDQYRGKIIPKHIDRKIGKKLSFINPTIWTIFGLAAGVAAFGLILQGSFILAVILYLLSGFCDLVDGMVSRYVGRSTEKGAYMDTIADRYTDFLIVAGLFLIDLPEVFGVSSKLLVFFYLFGSMMVTYGKTAAKEKNVTKKEISFGFLQRAERTFVICIGLLLGTINLVYLAYVIGFMAIFINFESLYRILKILAEPHKTHKVSK